MLLKGDTTIRALQTKSNLLFLRCLFSMKLLQVEGSILSPEVFSGWHWGSVHAALSCITCLILTAALEQLLMFRHAQCL